MRIVKITDRNKQNEINIIRSNLSEQLSKRGKDNPNHIHLYYYIYAKHPIYTYYLEFFNLSKVSNLFHFFEILKNIWQNMWFVITKKKENHIIIPATNNSIKTDILWYDYILWINFVKSKKTSWHSITSLTVHKVMNKFKKAILPARTWWIT